MLSVKIKNVKALCILIGNDLQGCTIKTNEQSPKQYIKYTTIWLK